MDHTHHDHGGMDMPGHGGMDMPGHGGHDGMSDMCSMNMLFTWDTNNLCIVFRSWRVTGRWSLLWTLLAVIALTAGYEAVREASRRYEARVATRIGNIPRAAAPAEEQKAKVIKAIFYGVQVFYSFFIMLLFMTYNGWIMLAVGIGAFVGYLLFGNTTATKTAACH